MYLAASYVCLYYYVLIRFELFCTFIVVIFNSIIGTHRIYYCTINVQCLGDLSAAMFNNFCQKTSETENIPNNDRKLKLLVGNIVT